jgi:hypothetical protein
VSSSRASWGRSWLTLLPTDVEAALSGRLPCARSRWRSSRPRLRAIHVAHGSDTEPAEPQHGEDGAAELRWGTRSQ